MSQIALNQISLKTWRIRGRRADGASAGKRFNVGTAGGVLLLTAGLGTIFALNLPAWIEMWLLAVAIFFGCKWLTWRGVSPELKTKSPARSWGYWFAWPGMDAESFLSTSVERTKPAGTSWAFAGLKLAIGVVLIWGGVRWAVPYGAIVAGWIGLIGVVFLLHFGLFHLLALAWQSCGVDARPIMDWPVGAASVSDFWGSRWNRAFRDLAHQFLYRPWCGRLGPQMASGAAFVVSGLLHDAVISIPARAGFGLPTLYFVIQFVGLCIERSTAGRWLGLRRGIAGRVFAVIVLVLPAGLLFHAPFIHRVVLPMLAALGAVK